MREYVHCFWRESMLRIAWCADPAEFSYAKRLLVECARARGHRVTVIHGWDDVPAGESFDAGVLRSRDAPVDPECCEVARELESRGVPFLNSTRAREASKDKTVTACLFEQAGVDQPLGLRTGGDARELAGPVIAKPRCGGRGEGIVRFSSAEDALAEGIDLAQYLVQRYYPRRAVWRVIATRERPLRAYSRRPLPPTFKRLIEWRTDVRRRRGAPRVERRGDPRLVVRDLINAQGELLLPLRPPRAVGQMGVEMVRAVGGDLMGADVIVAEGRPLALEVNTNFGLQAHDRWLIRRVIEEVEHVAARRSSPPAASV